MTHEDIRLVQRTWKALQPISGPVAILFYERLFALDPQLKPLFRFGIGEQGRKLVAMIGAVVNGLENLGALAPILRELGRRHALYGVRDGDYETVGTALLWSLGMGLGPDFTPAAQRAWTAVYETLSGLMKEPAADSTA